MEHFRKFAGIMSKPIICDHLSKLQRLALVMLCEPQLAILKRRPFFRAVRALHFHGDDSPSICTSLNRSLRNLEDRQLIRRFKGGWVLTEYPPHNNGVIMAFLAWRRDSAVYAKLDLKGPPTPKPKINENNI